MDVSKNRITGNLPTTIGSFAKLSKFNVADNSITDEIPTEIGLLPAAIRKFVDCYNTAGRPIQY